MNSNLLREGNRDMKMFYVKFFLLVSVCAPIFSMDILRQRYAWPENKPSVPEDYNSMFFNHTQLGKVMHKDMSVVIELGSWLGASTLFLLERAPHATVIAIDHWLGSIEHHIENNPVYTDRLKTLYETFLVNCWAYQDRLIPIRTTTLQGLQMVYFLGIVPDLIYVDASHDFDSVLADLEKSHSCFPSALLVGDDWGWKSVRTAVEFFAQKHSFKIEAEESFWKIIK